MFLFFVCLFFLNNSVSSSICKLPIRSEIYNCTFKNTNKVAIMFCLFLVFSRMNFIFNDLHVQLKALSQNFFFRDPGKLFAVTAMCPIMCSFS